MNKLLIVDDNPEIRKQLKWGLGREYSLLLAASGDEALELFKNHHPAVVTLDLGLPPDLDGATEGFRCLEAMLIEDPRTKVIVLSGNDERANVLRAVELGAYDFYQKPIDLSELKVILHRAFNLAAIEAENRRLHGVLAIEGDGMSGMLGQCPRMLEVFASIRKVATTDVPVLVLGESGTGKELVGRALHSRSLRREQAFIPINCGAIPEALLESELFGHEKGAFTGAQGRVRGKIEYADGGTLFLDEIGEMPASLQVKLLRFLQDKMIQRVGGREDFEVDARIIAATNVDIEKAIAEDKFREDLFYRIGVVTITLPPLRERGDDLVLLGRYFLKRSCAEFGRRVRGFSPAALAAMREYEWPGNVRELENKVKRAVLMSTDALVEVWDLGLAPRPAEVETAAAPVDEKAAAGSCPDGEKKPGGGVTLELSGLKLKEARLKLEKELLLAAVRKYQGNVKVMAAELGVSRPTLYDLMKKHGLH